MKPHCEISSACCHDTLQWLISFSLGGDPNQAATKKGIMAFKELTITEVDELLTGERAMRIGFDANNERYLVPLGFIWHEGALYAMTTQGCSPYSNRLY
jgi:hypothetical protein